jgi:hypothetical protein
MEKKLNFIASVNWYIKEENGLLFLGDIFHPISNLLQISLIICGIIILLSIAKRLLYVTEDNKNPEVLPP